MIIVSACLAGVMCRYNGQDFPVPAVIELVNQGKAIPVCPEMLAGLTAPRQPGEQRHDRIYAKDGSDVTADYLTGAKMAFAIAVAANCQKAIVKSKSPTCGSGLIYDGTFTGKLIPGDGVFTRLLKNSGIEVLTETELAGPL